MTTLRAKLIKSGAKVVRHAWYVTFEIAEVTVPHRLHRAISARIRRLAAPSGESHYEKRRDRVLRNCIKD